MNSQYAQNRLETRIMEAVNTLIVTGAIKNHGLSTLASVNDIELSKDNAYATLYVTCMSDENAMHRSVAALQGAAGFIQARLANLLRTKNTPKLRFVADMNELNARHMDELIDSLHITDEKKQ